MFRQEQQAHLRSSLSEETSRRDRAIAWPCIDKNSIALVRSETDVSAETTYISAIARDQSIRVVTRNDVILLRLKGLVCELLKRNVETNST